MRKQTEKGFPEGLSPITARAIEAGRVPFRAEHAVAVLRRVFDDTLEPIRRVNPDIPAWLAGIVASLHDNWAVKYIAPVHCTGEPAFAALKQTFGLGRSTRSGLCWSPAYRDPSRIAQALAAIFFLTWNRAIHPFP